ncbi:hypothetical protein [Brachybacterium sp.]|uniref:hypothetical protein n=1 Tax=Brachybacterium sp. TaxID=1891286 RepID=UPI002ED14EC4
MSPTHRADGPAAGAGAAAVDAPEADALTRDAPATEIPMPDSPATLTSLSSLLGGTVEGGAACAADGTCD